MSNTYHLLASLPVWKAGELPLPLEQLARQIVASGLLRVKSDTARNFVTYSGPGFDLTFSRREMTDPALLPTTRDAIAQTLPSAAGEQGVEEVYQRLGAAFRRAGEIEPEKELQVARLLVQAAHPVVIRLCLLERVQLFVSYAHNVADLMAMHFWESAEGSGGLQTISGDGAAVYVSCGGDPFIEKEEHKTYVSDGFPALARCLVIAAQELGHYADLRRDAYGRIAARHSAWLLPLMAREPVAQARLSDLQQMQAWLQHALRLRIPKLADLEKRLGFLRTHRRYAPLTHVLHLRVAAGARRVRNAARREGLTLFAQFPASFVGGKGWAANVVECLGDMAFNLAPNHEAYRRESPREEEAIACIEALARVPQQAVKWGHAVTQRCWPDLYRIYYGEVIPECIASYERLAGQPWHFPELIWPRRFSVLRGWGRPRNPY